METEIRVSGRGGTGSESGKLLKVKQRSKEKIYKLKREGVSRRVSEVMSEMSEICRKCRKCIKGSELCKGAEVCRNLTEGGDSWTPNGRLLVL